MVCCYATTGPEDALRLVILWLEDTAWRSALAEAFWWEASTRGISAIPRCLDVEMVFFILSGHLREKLHP